MTNTNATEFRNILVDMPDFPGAEVEYWLLTRFAANGTEAFPKKKYVQTLDANGQGTQALPVPSTGAWLWRVVTPDGKPPYNPTLAAGADLQLTTWLASAQSTETAASLADQFAGLVDFDAHVADTTAVHGIADTSLLETTAGAQAKADAVAADLTTHEADTSNPHAVTAAQAGADPAGSAAAAQAASEPALGNPGTDGHVLSSTIAGVRSWVAGGSGGGGIAAVTDSLSRSIAPTNLLGYRASGLRLRRALADIADGTRQSLRVLAVGDSLATTIWPTVHTQLQRLFEGHYQSTPVYGGAGLLATGDFVTSAAFNSLPSSGKYTGVYNLKTDYDMSWAGSNMELAAGQYCIYSSGNNLLVCDRILIPIVTEPGAGSVRIEITDTVQNPPVVGAGDWRDPIAGEIAAGPALTGTEWIIDANAALGVTVVELTLDLDFHAVKITHEAGGNVRCLWPMHQVDGAAATNIYRISEASNDFTDTSATADPVMAGLIASYDPDVIVIESDDTLAAYQNFLPLLEAAISTAALTHNPLVLLVGNPYIGAGGGVSQAELATRINYCWTYAESRIGWDVLDGLAIAGGYVEATAAAWAGNAIHYENAISWAITRKWAESRGYMPTALLRAGGDATAEDVLTVTSQRLVTAEKLMSLLVSPVVQDTGIHTWSYLNVGTGAGSRTAAQIQMFSGTTPDSTVVAYVNDMTPIGYNQGWRPLALPGGFSFHFRISAATGTAGVARIIWTSDRNNNAAHAGALTGDGVGFEFNNNILTGICWNGSAQVASPSSATITIFGYGSQFQEVALILTPATVSSTSGTCEWFLNGASLGTNTYAHVGVAKSLRAELTNGADGQLRLHFTPPKVVTVR